MLTTQGCVADGLCEIEEIDVVVDGDDPYDGYEDPEPGTDECLEVVIGGSAPGVVFDCGISEPRKEGSGSRGGSAPPGMDEEYWDSLNDEEKALCLQSLSECFAVYSAAREASSWAAKEEPTGAHNRPQDALRHAKWNANMTQSIGSVRAKVWATAHEASSSDAAETAMDLHNNQVGREIGATWEVYSKVVDRRLRG